MELPTYLSLTPLEDLCELQVKELDPQPMYPHMSNTFKVLDTYTKHKKIKYTIELVVSFLSLSTYCFYWVTRHRFKKGRSDP